MPVPDDRMQKVIDLLRLKKKHLKILYKKFKHHDKDKSGTIDINEFYKMIHETRSVFGDSVFELIDIDDNGTLDFSEFVQTLGTYCMFGSHDILKFCYYVFDKDKNGYIEQDELHALIDMLHGNHYNSNCKVALEKFDLNKDGKIDYGEFQLLNTNYPQLLFPAFRMQENMMIHSLGMKWWRSRKQMLEGDRATQRRHSEELRRKEEKRQKKIRQREIKRKMGSFRYYFMFWERGKYLAQINAEKKKKKKKKKKEKAEDWKRQHMELMKEKDAGPVKKKKKKKKKGGDKEYRMAEKASTNKERDKRKKKRAKAKEKREASG